MLYQTTHSYTTHTRVFHVSSFDIVNKPSSFFCIKKVLSKEKGLIMAY